MNTACALCERAHTLDASSGWMLATAHWGVSPHPALQVPGWVAVQTLRHTEGLGTLDMAEAQTLGLVLSRVSAALARATDAKRIYTYSLGERVPHTHILMGPPGHGLRGREFLDRLLQRDESLVDQPAAERVSADFADLLTANGSTAHEIHG
jgi:diadenosine tetraphosphate (Ap4A) HIT family hydrolase